jgi:hypothetical protein
MGFLNKIFSSLAGVHSADEYVDLGQGLEWFKEYALSGKSTLSDFFGLTKEGRIKIKAKIGKTGFYQTEKGKRWAVIANYVDENGKEFTFYCPGWEYDPIGDYGQGNILEMFVDKDDFSKYEMPIY